MKTAVDEERSPERFLCRLLPALLELMTLRIAQRLDAKPALLAVRLL